ncbi:hypothetical protein V9T40_001721 [Parthenolecanium corni]|uniref:Heparan-alpha-glucosaminide N-acetyltransferase catalytic domain-containing protein n=1 Tax=Parthenolecanium corni TaxID=536013 RepID=A0AAN9TJI0_9HEMI
MRGACAVSWIWMPYCPSMGFTMSVNPVLRVNEAALWVTTNISDLSLWAQAVDCYRCDLIEWANINEEATEKFSTNSKWNFELRNPHRNVNCSAKNVKLGELGQYKWNYYGKCEPIKNSVPPVDPFQPVYYFESFLLAFVCLRAVSKFAFKQIHRIRRFRSWSSSNEIERDLGSPSDARELITSSPTSSVCVTNKRIKSLDVFRGLAIALMIFVNYGGGQYWIFEHSPWNGLTIADVVFPWFAWIMGVGIAIKIKFDKRNSIPTKDLVFQCLRRSLTLIILGLIISNLHANDLTHYRYFGVLQRLGLAYCFVTLLEIVFMEPQSPQSENTYMICLRDLSESWKQWCVVFVCVAVHTGLTFFLPVPGCPRGYLGPGGLGDHAQYRNCTGGAAGYIDRTLFGENHVYARPTCRTWYQCNVPYDPEGALGTLTTILCVYLGVYAGRVILVYRRSGERIVRWITASICCMILTTVICFGNINEGFIPVNKNLWSLSFVLLCSSFAFLVFVIIYIFVDEKKWYSGSSLYHVGRFSLLIYIGHVLADDVFPWAWKPWNTSTHTEYFLMNTWGTVLWIIIARFLDTKDDLSWKNGFEQALAVTGIIIGSLVILGGLAWLLTPVFGYRICTILGNCESQVLAHSSGGNLQDPGQANAYPSDMYNSVVSPYMSGYRKRY